MTETHHPKFSQRGDRATLAEHQAALKLLLQELDRVCGLLNIPYFLFAGTLLGAVRSGEFIPWDDDLDVIMDRQDYARLCREAPGVLGEDFYFQGEYSSHWPFFFSKLRLNGTTCLERCHYKDQATHMGVYIDIFPLDHGYDSLAGRLLQFAASKVVIAKGLDLRGYDTKNPAKKLLMLLTRPLPLEPFRRLVLGPEQRGKYVHCFLGAASRYSRSVFPAEYFAGRSRVSFEGETYPAPRCSEAVLTRLYGDWKTLPDPRQREQKVHAILVDLTRPQEEYAHTLRELTYEGVTKSIR